MEHKERYPQDFPTSWSVGSWWPSKSVAEKLLLRHEMNSLCMSMRRSLQWFPGRYKWKAKWKHMFCPGFRIYGCNQLLKTLSQVKVSPLPVGPTLFASFHYPTGDPKPKSLQVSSPIQRSTHIKILRDYCSIICLMCLDLRILYSLKVETRENPSNDGNKMRKRYGHGSKATKHSLIKWTSQL